MTRNCCQDEVVLRCIRLPASETIFIAFTEPTPPAQLPPSVAELLRGTGQLQRPGSRRNDLISRVVTKYHRKITKMDRRYPY